MAQSQETLPEGTDSIIPGASFDGRTDGPAEDEGTVDGPTVEGPSVEGEAGDGFALAHGQKLKQAPLESDGPKQSLKDEAVQVAGEKAAGIRDQAAEKVRAFAVQGKDRATDAIDNVVRLVDEAAATVDDKVGAQYGDYVRRAGETLAGVATTFRDKDVDDLLADARGVIRSSPAVAIGAAAAVGFLVARIAKAGATPAEAGDHGTDTATVA